MSQFESPEQKLPWAVPSLAAPILYTEREMLVPYTAEYLPFMIECFGNWDIIQNFSVKIKAKEAEKNALQKLYDTANGDAKFIILPRTAEHARALGTEAGEPLGFIDYHKKPVDGLSHRMFAMHPKFERLGLMNEAVNRTLHYVFITLGWDELLLCNAVDNGRSNNLKARDGIIETGIIEKKYNNGAKFARTFRQTRNDYLQSDMFVKEDAAVRSGKFAPRQLFLRRLSAVAILPVAATLQTATSQDAQIPLARLTLES